MKILKNKIALTMMVVLSLAFVLSFIQSSIFAQEWPDYYYEGPTGGTGGTSFADIEVDYNKEPPLAFHLEMVKMWVSDSGGSIINLAVQDGHDPMAPATWASKWYGGQANPFKHSLKTFELQPGERLVGIDGTYNKVVTSIRFKARSQDGTERLPDFYGRFQGQSVYSYTAPPGCEIVAFWGRSGSTIDAIGPIIKCSN